MKDFTGRVIYWIFTIALIVLLYLYYFDRSRYDALLTWFFGDQSEDPSRKDYYYRNLIYSYLCFYVAYFIISPICKKRIYEIAQTYYKNYPQKRLYDVGHQFIPYSKYSNTIAEIIITFISVSILIYFILHPNIQLLYSLFYLYAVIVIFRSCAFMMTLLPDASQRCNFSKLFGSCNDLLFSGHTSKTLLLLLLCGHYRLFPSSLILQNYYILFALMLIFIISARNHYTIDIFFAILVTLLVYFVYYNLFG
jgi:PAP2 superfamily C-terminal